MSLRSTLLLAAVVSIGVWFSLAPVTNASSDDWYDNSGYFYDSYFDEFFDDHSFDYGSFFDDYYDDSRFGYGNYYDSLYFGGYDYSYSNYYGHNYFDDSYLRDYRPTKSYSRAPKIYKNYHYPFFFSNKNCPCNFDKGPYQFPTNYRDRSFSNYTSVYSNSFSYHYWPFYGYESPFQYSSYGW